jgi:hypothetical protein
VDHGDREQRADCLRNQARPFDQIFNLRLADKDAPK